MATHDRLIQSMAQLFKILGDSTRLRLLTELQDGEQNVTRLCRTMKMAQPTVSHHLGILRMGGVVSTRRSGKEIYYSIREDKPKQGRLLREIIQIAESLNK